MLLSTAYLPPITHFAKIESADSFIIESNEHFVKQTLRNRCHILSPNGIQTLVVPVVHDNRTNTAMKDIRIAYNHPWQRQHWRSLNAAYRRSAFFEFYMDDFAPFYHKPYEFLLDFNSGLLRLIMESMKMKKEINFTVKYEKTLVNVDSDLRFLSDAGLSDSNSPAKSYPQVFSYKFGFVPGLSMVDLLFNAGPTSKNYFTIE